MDRRPRRNIDNDLQQLERELAALTLKVAALRNQNNNNQNNNNNNAHHPHGPNIGDRVSFRILGRGTAEGTIVHITAHRVRIRQDITNHLFDRAAHNVVVLPSLP
jgi:hypothetical protein